MLQAAFKIHVSYPGSWISLDIYSKLFLPMAARSLGERKLVAPAGCDHARIDSYLVDVVKEFDSLAYVTVGWTTLDFVCEFFL